MAYHFSNDIAVGSSTGSSPAVDSPVTTGIHPVVFQSLPNINIDIAAGLASLIAVDLQPTLENAQEAIAPSPERQPSSLPLMTIPAGSLWNMRWVSYLEGSYGEVNSYFVSPSPQSTSFLEEGDMVNIFSRQLPEQPMWTYIGAANVRSAYSFKLVVFTNCQADFSVHNEYYIEYSSYMVLGTDLEWQTVVDPAAAPRYIHDILLEQQYSEVSHYMKASGQHFRHMQALKDAENNSPPMKVDASVQTENIDGLTDHTAVGTEGGSNTPKKAETVVDFDSMLTIECLISNCRKKVNSLSQNVLTFYEDIHQMNLIDARELALMNTLMAKNCRLGQVGWMAQFHSLVRTARDSFKSKRSLRQVR